MDKHPKNLNNKNKKKTLPIIFLILLSGLFVFVISMLKGQDQQNYQDSVQQISKTGNQIINQQSQSQSTQKDLPSIFKEWRKSTASIVCDWFYSDGSLIQESSATGLIAMVDSIPTIITNKHVVYSTYYGYTSGCIIKFPDDNGFYMYSNNCPKTTGGYYLNQGILTVDSNGYDVAYISGFESSWTPSDLLNQPLPNISLNERINSNVLCKSKENTGDSILILGYPIYGSQNNTLGSLAEPTVTEGIISGVDGIYYTTSAKVDHGNSGGLAIDEKNNCYFGIPTWNESGSFESLGRILPASTFLHY